jgi:hypothetical protein
VSDDHIWCYCMALLCGAMVLIYGSIVVVLYGIW